MMIIIAFLSIAACAVGQRHEDMHEQGWHAASDWFANGRPEFVTDDAGHRRDYPVYHSRPVYSTVGDVSDRVSNWIASSAPQPSIAPAASVPVVGPGFDSKLSVWVRGANHSPSSSSSSASLPSSGSATSNAAPISTPWDGGISPALEQWIGRGSGSNAPVPAPEVHNRGHQSHSDTNALPDKLTSWLNA